MMYIPLFCQSKHNTMYQITAMFAFHKAMVNDLYLSFLYKTQKGETLSACIGLFINNCSTLFY